MSILLHQLIHNSAERAPDSPAVGFQGVDMCYQELAGHVLQIGGALLDGGLAKHDRVCIYLPKQFETVIAFFAVSQAGGVFVPVNPLLKPRQVEYIIQNCNARVLITNRQRLEMLCNSLATCDDLQTVICTDLQEQDEFENLPGHIQVTGWQQLLTQQNINNDYHRVIETDMVSILYTSGSTGKPKGVVLSHLNMVTGAESVAQYLANTSSDRVLAVLPFSFDYGFSQLTTVFYVGASVVLLDYLFPIDVIRIAEQEGITGIAAVPTLWMQLRDPNWSAEVRKKLRYITNSGGALPRHVIENLRRQLPETKIYLMYGFTEAFRSSYLSPEELDKRPDSIGKAIPNAELMVINEAGHSCAPGEHGELVHRGPLVAMGYWNDPESTARCFRPAPGHASELPLTEIAAWSGDTVRMDEEGYLYFVGRRDDMIKTSGYRVSPTEIEEVIHATGLVQEVVALGVPHLQLGQVILVVITVEPGNPYCREQIMYACKQGLPNYMLPNYIEIVDEIPKTPHGKIDRKCLLLKYIDYFQDSSE